MTTQTTTTPTPAEAPRLAARAAVLLIGACTALTALAACNTTEGVGRDIEAAGDGLGDAARDAKD